MPIDQSEEGAGAYFWAKLSVSIRPGGRRRTSKAEISMQDEKIRERWMQDENGWAPACACGAVLGTCMSWRNMRSPISMPVMSSSSVFGISALLQITFTCSSPATPHMHIAPHAVSHPIMHARTRTRRNKEGTAQVAQTSVPFFRATLVHRSRSLVCARICVCAAAGLNGNPTF